MILEGIVTTLNADGSVNISPMGPCVDRDMQTFELRPYRTSTTYQNLKRHGEGVFHVTDDVMLLAQAAVGNPHPLPALETAQTVQGMILADTCRWYEFRVRSLDDVAERTAIVVDVAHAGSKRDFIGFNRAKNAVLEAAILATRIRVLPGNQIIEPFRQLRTLVEKTGDEQEHAAFQFLEDYVNSALGLSTNQKAPMP